MQLLDSSMDKIAERVYHQLRSTIPEQILGKMTVAVSWTLSSLVIGPACNSLLLCSCDLM